MKILNITMSTNTVTGGGSVERILKLHKHFNAVSGVSSKILSIENNPVSDAKLPKEELILLPVMNRRWYIPSLKFSLIWQLVKWSDVVHFMNHWTVINVWVFIIASILNKPYIICPAGSLKIFGRSIWLKRIYQLLVGRKLIRKASAAIILAEHEKHNLKYIDTINYIPNGVDAEDFAYDNPEKFRTLIGLSADIPYLLFLGRLNEIKGPDLILEAFFELAEQIPHHLIFVGPDEGMKRTLCRRINTQGLDHRVHFFDYVAGEMKSSAYHGAEVLLVPSRNEAMSIVALEAAVSGTPVLLSTECGFSELAEHGGAIESKPDVNELKKNLAHILDVSTDRKMMGKKARQLVLTNYSWMEAAKRHITLFTKIIHENDSQIPVTIKGIRLIKKLIFPAVYAINMFAVTALLIVLGLSNNGELAADVGIVQAASTLVFLSFTANARNLILSEGYNAFSQIVIFRLIFVFPLAIVSYYLSTGFVEYLTPLVYLLVLRKACEWISDIQLSEREYSQDYTFCCLYSLMQTLLFLFLAACIVFKIDAFFYPVFLLWSISPCAFVFSLTKNGIQNIFPFSWRLLSLHIGSSLIVSSSTFLFRVLILLLTGKEIGGLLFSAFSIGSVINSVYTYAIGPSISLNSQENKTQSDTVIMHYISLLLIFSGGFIALTNWSVDTGVWSDKLFYMTIGFSVAGSGLMILAQRLRIHMLKMNQKSVFIPDVLSNILIIVSAPFAFFLFGYSGISALMAWNALVTYLIFIIPFIQYASLPAATSNLFYAGIAKIINRQNIQLIILISIVLPIFFQLSGTIYTNPIEMSDHGGSLQKSPLPVSILACFTGIAFIIRNHLCRISAIFIFSFFITLLLSILANSVVGATHIGLSKIILMIQYILPAFALIIGQSYIEPVNKDLRYESIFVCIVSIIVITEVIATLAQNTIYLTPELYLFDLYQHLQYLPAIFMGIYFLAISTFPQTWPNMIFLLLMAPMCLLYSLFSFSLLCIFLYVICMLILLYRLNQSGFFKLLYKYKFILIFFGMLVLFYLGIWMIENRVYIETYYAQYKPYIGLKLTGNIPNNLYDRLYYWTFYLDGITSSVNLFLFGHTEVLDREIIPSAHNYYLGLVYNFGILPLIPIILLIFYTISLTFKIRASLHSGLAVFPLFLLVMFYLLIDNSLKVGLRQPYSGIIVFFLWGVLLTRLTQQKSNGLSREHFHD